MAHISVTLKIIIPQNYVDVVYEYNKMKPTTWEPLKKIENPDVFGGFEIGLVKQVTWHNRILRTRNAYQDFSEGETHLLFTAMVKVFGEEKVGLSFCWLP